MAFVYETTIDPTADNNCHAFALEMVGYNKRVLEVGCATGFFTKVLTERGCRVVGIELDPDAAAIADKWAERVVVGDIDAGDVWDELGEEEFDAITFGDVLEHLRDPLGALRSAVQRLKPSGVVVASVPNIAHGDVRISLLKGSFTYREVGLLDRTHIRFFTKTSVRDLFRDAGLVPVEMRRVIVPLFQSELGLKRKDVSESIVNEILTDPEAESYQFVVKAVLDNGTRTMTLLSDRIAELSDHAHNEGVRTALLREELDHRRTRMAELEAEVDHLEGELAAMRNTRTFRAVAPLRKVYGRLMGPPAPAGPAAGPGR